MMNREKLIEAFDVYDRSIIHFVKACDAFGADAIETKTAKELVGEAREELISMILKVVEEVFLK
jgi:hypothetical protein